MLIWIDLDVFATMFDDNLLGKNILERGIAEDADSDDNEDPGLSYNWIIG